MASGDAAAERAAFADEVLLADELRERPRSHPSGERLALGRWLEERLWFRAACLGTGGRHAVSLEAPGRPPSPRRSWS